MDAEVRKTAEAYKATVLEALGDVATDGTTAGHYGRRVLNIVNNACYNKARGRKRGCAEKLAQLKRIKTETSLKAAELLESLE